MCSYAVVTAYTAGYEDGYTALVNSLKQTNPSIPIHTVGPDIDKAQFPYYSDRQQSNGWYAKGARHKLASQMAKEHDAILVLDADMIVLRDLTMFFDIAAKAEVLIGVANGSNIYYKDRPYVKEPFYHPKTISNVPLFVPKKYGYIYEMIHEIFATHHSAEFDVTNYVIYKECLDRLLVLPPQNWTNIHHFMQKPDTHIHYQHGELVANGMPVYSMHGKLWSEGYRDGLVWRMDKYLDGFNVNKFKQVARQAKDIMVSEWERCRGS